jgi:hypothetical protein
MTRRHDCNLVETGTVCFFEKKNQKTLTHCLVGAIRIGPRPQTDKSFLLLFFKKEESFLDCQISDGRR